MKRAPIKKLPTQKRLRELLYYNQETGAMTWRIRENHNSNRYVERFNNHYAGESACRPTTSGYLRVFIDGKEYLAHRVAYKWMTGNEPPEMLDHKDTDKANNAWLNLREATNSMNQGNVKPRSKSGVRGVVFIDGMWRFTASWSFKTFEEARDASAAFNAERFGEFVFNPANDNTPKMAAA